MGDLVLTDEELQKIYVWVDSIPLSRPKRNIARDFSDGVMLAEVLHHYFPKLVELHNYSAANSVRQKLYNWGTLNQKVLKRIDYEIKKSDIEGIVNCKPGVIEGVLLQVQDKISDFRAKRAATGQSSPTAADASPATSRSIDHIAPSPAPSMSGAPVARALVLPGSTVPAAALSVSGPVAGSGVGVDASIVAEKDATIHELRETVEILELKIKKLEQLVKLKDQRIQTLTARLQAPPGTTPSGPM